MDEASMENNVRILNQSGCSAMKLAFDIAEPQWKARLAERLKGHVVELVKGEEFSRRFINRIISTADQSTKDAVILELKGHLIDLGATQSTWIASTRGGVHR